MFENVKKSFNNLIKKAYSSNEPNPYKDQITAKPEMDIFPMSAGIKHPDMMPSLPLLKQVHDNSPNIKIATMRLRETIFRRGFEWESKFKSKCPDCGKEYKDKKVNICEQCGTKTIEPDTIETQRSDEFFKKVNVNGQQLMNVLKNIEDDLNIFDDAYLVGIKEYIQDAEGEIVFTSLKEIVRGNPITMRIVATENGELGGKWWTCLRHRDVIEESRHTRCPKCHRKLFEVLYVSTFRGGESPKSYYVDGEVIHISKYAPSQLYGFSPIVTLWEYALTLVHMMKYVYHSYTVQHLPKGILAIKTSNPDAAFKFWKDTDDKLQKDPHYIPKMFIEGDTAKGAGMEFVRFMDTLEEMEYIPVRDEIRRTIASMYGISNIFMGDTAGVGGLNAEGEQIQITNMAAESAMLIYNDRVLVELTKWLNVKDWEFKLLSPFTQSKQRELVEQQTETQIATMMLGMGFDVELDDHGHFKYSGNAKNPMDQQQQLMGGGQLPPEPTIPEEEQEIQAEDTMLIHKYTGEKAVDVESEEFRKVLNDIFNKEIAKVFKGTEKFSRVEMKKFTNQVLKQAVVKMKLQTDAHITDIYKAGGKYVGEMLKQAVDFSKVDANAVEAITKNKVLWEAYQGMGRNLSTKLNKIITESYKKPETFSLSEMVAKMREEADVATYKLDRIVRTETQAAAMKGRENAFRKFDPEGTYLYKWAVRHDQRTSEICKDIEKAIDTESQGKGVPLNRANQIIKDISLKYNGQDWQYRDFVPHINCRSGLVRTQ